MSPTLEASAPVLVLGALSIICFWAGARLGRWPVWLLGYALLVAAVAIPLVRPW